MHCKLYYIELLLTIHRPQAQFGYNKGTDEERGEQLTGYYT
jgi:hypothetical protein